MKFMNMDYKQYLESEAWQEKKRQVFARALKNANSNNRHGVCERCGYEPWKPILQVHHLSYEHIFNEPLEDLILLCPHCHKAETEKARGNSVSKAELSFEIKQRLAVLSTTNNYQKQANLISWNGKPESLDIRTWNIKDESKPTPLKGVILTTDEVKALKEAIDGLEMLK